MVYSMAKKSQKKFPLSTNTANQPNVLDRKQARRDAKQLGLSKADLPNSIKEIIATLNEAGFEAYIVGGGVRDSLLGLQPKDFDAVTNATPNQIKEVFGKRCRIIGRRFLLCHVYSGRDMIEVATFRAAPKDDTHLTEDGMIMRDNVWGDIFQDVVRRDFSINALYYQPNEGFVYDFCGGLKDMQSRTIRLLGNTQKRVEEDPVRLLRALRFKAKLGFEFDAELEQQFNDKNWALLSQVSPHRLYDETQKMFSGGYLTPLLPLLFEYGAIAHLIFYPPKLATPLVEQVTVNTDKRIGQGKSINPAFFYAALLWENYLYLLDKLKKTLPFAEAQIQAAHKVMDKQRPHTAMPKFAEQFIKDIWLMQTRLAEPRKKNLLKLFENPRFRAGFDFLLLREQVEAKNRALSAELGQAVTLDSEPTNGMGHWWAWFQTLNAKQQQRAIDEFDINAVRLRFANVVHSDSSHHTTHPTPNTDSEPSKSRRNRRRGKAETHGLTEQEQQEKDQLQLLSLANQNAVQKPAQPLWGTPFNHQIAETETIKTADNPQIEKLEKVKKSANTHLDETPQHNRRKKPLQSERQVNQVPTVRKRRQPSSDLTVIEKRQMAENQTSLTEQTLSNDEQKIENTTQMADILTVKTAKIPAKRTRKKIVDTETVKEKAKQIESEVENVKIQSQSENVAEKLPVKRGRKPKAVVENAEVLEVNTETIMKKIPAKRTRKKLSE